MTEEKIDSVEKLRRMRLKLLNSNALKLAGSLYYNFKVDLIDSNEIMKEIEQTVTDPEVLKHVQNKFTAFAWFDSTVKPRITFYTHMVEQESVEELITDFLHEMFHLLDGDCYKIARHMDNKEIYNLAADHVIDIMLKKSISHNEIPAKFPENLFYIPALEDQNLTKEEVFEWINQRAKNNKCVGKFTGPDGREYEIKEIDLEDDSNNESDSSSNRQSKNRSNSNGKTNRKIRVFCDVGEGQNPQKEKEKTESLKAEARAAKDILQCQNRGLSSGFMNDYIDKILEVKIPWNELILKAIATKVVPRPDNRSWRNINKRMATYNILLPGPDYDIKPHKLIFDEDTSGSMGREDMMKAGSMIQQSANFFDEIRVIKHDVQVTEDKTIQSCYFVDDDLIYNHQGRGGTSHKYCFDLIQKAFDEGDKISMVLFTTDFYSDIQEIWSSYTWHKYIPVKFILNNKIKIPAYIDDSPIYIDEKDED